MDPYRTDDFAPPFRGSFRQYCSGEEFVRSGLHVARGCHAAGAIGLDTGRATSTSGERIYLPTTPYVLIPRVVPTVGLYPEPRAACSIAEVTSSEWPGMRHEEIGTAQSWYYPADRTICIWECYLRDFARAGQLTADANMGKFWDGLESWLTATFPDATRLVTPFRDPLFPDEEYQDFLQVHGYAPVAKAAFGKAVKQG